MHATTTARGFEPLRAEPNGFLVHHLNHSVTLSMWKGEQAFSQQRVSRIRLPRELVFKVRLARRAQPVQSLPLQRHRP